MLKVRAPTSIPGCIAGRGASDAAHRPSALPRSDHDEKIQLSTPTTRRASTGSHSSKSGARPTMADSSEPRRSPRKQKQKSLDSFFKPKAKKPKPEPAKPDGAEPAKPASCTREAKRPSPAEFINTEILCIHINPPSEVRYITVLISSHPSIPPYSTVQYCIVYV